VQRPSHPRRVRENAGVLRCGFGARNINATILASPVALHGTGKALQTIVAGSESPRRVSATLVTAADPTPRRTWRCTPLEFFYRKLFRMVHARLLSLCEKLQITGDVLQRVSH